MSTVWKVTRYARSTKQQSNSSKHQEKDWEYYDDSERSLQATLQQEGYFVFKHGDVIMEFLNLLNGRSWIRGSCKGDSMWLVTRHQDGTRRCRLRFAGQQDTSAAEMCRQCANRLGQYFPLKIMPSTNDNVNNTDAAGQTGNKTIVDGEINLSGMAKIITKDSTFCLPEAYQKLANVSSEDVDAMLRMCLADPTFPAFVSQVEERLNAIKKENV